MTDIDKRVDDYIRQSLRRLVRANHRTLLGDIDAQEMYWKNRITDPALQEEVKELFKDFRNELDARVKQIEFTENALQAHLQFELKQIDRLADILSRSNMNHPHVLGNLDYGRAHARQRYDAGIEALGKIQTKIGQIREAIKAV